MSKAPTVKTEVFVDGILATDLNNDDLLFKIQTCQQAIENLKGLGLKSSNVDKMIAKQEKSIADLVELLDSRKIA